MSLLQSFGVLRRLGLAAILAVLVAGTAAAQDDTDRLGVPGPIAFDGVDYALAWSAAPSPTYVKQEYLPAGQSPERFDSMVLLEVVEGDLDVAGAAGAQVAMLNERKASDPLVNMDLIRNDATGEIILDFILSARDGEGEIIAEWNAYRYASLAENGGGNGVMLMAISRRAYGDEAVRTFLGELRTVRPDQINKLATASLPAINR